MKLCYENKPDDISTYALLVYQKSPTVKKHRSRSINAALVIIVIMSVIIMFLDSNNYQTLFIWLILSVLWMLYIPIQHRRRYIKNMRKSFESDEHKNFFGKHCLTFDDSGLTDTKDIGVNHTAWEKIEHLEVTEQNTYIFIDMAMAFIIPKGSITEGDYVEFITSLKSKFKEKL